MISNVSNILLEDVKISSNNLCNLKIAKYQLWWKLQHVKESGALLIWTYFQITLCDKYLLKVNNEGTGTFINIALVPLLLTLSPEGKHS